MARLVHGDDYSTQGRKKCPKPVLQPCLVAATTRDGREEPGAGLRQQEWLEESLHGITVWVPLTRCPVCLWVGDMALSHVLGAAQGSTEG